MATFDTAQKFVAKWEGGLTDHPDDPGGITNYGVSLRFLKDLAGKKENADALERMGVIFPIGPDSIRKLTPDMAASIFRWRFWLVPKLDEFPPLTAIVTYDANVNTGTGQSTKFLQRSCNAFEGEKLDVDGLIGPKTRARAMSMLKQDLVLAEMCIGERESFYKALVADKPSYAPFRAGWLNRTKDLRNLVRGLGA
ncbi:MAG: hypothetical protein LBQ10_12075 [Desulfovibrio sp.]|jgi:lysozyme family protein|nr:hypothetical protein [Desulfovibrio sp.]